MPVKFKKVLLLSFTLLFIHLVFSALYIPISDLADLSNGLSQWEKFRYVFTNFYVALLFPYALECHYILKR